MGDEVLEDTEFEPMFDGCKDALKGKNIALFGSYGWEGLSISLPVIINRKDGVHRRV